MPDDGKLSVDPSVWAGVGTIVTAMAGGAAAVVAAFARRRTEAESHEDATARRLAAERAAITEEYRGLIEALREHNKHTAAHHASEVRRIEERVQRVEAALNASRAEHASCEESLAVERAERSRLAERLRVAETRLADLEEKPPHDPRT